MDTKGINKGTTMKINKTITLDFEEVKKILTKFIEKKLKCTVDRVDDHDGDLQFHLTPVDFDETGD